MKKGIFVEGTLKAGRLLNKYFVDFDGFNIVNVGHPRGYNISPPFEDGGGFEYFDRTFVQMQFVVHLFSEKEAVREKSFKALVSAMNMIKTLGVKGLIVDFKNATTLFEVIDILNRLISVGISDMSKLFITNSSVGVMSDFDVIDKYWGLERMVIDIANAWAAGYGMTDKHFSEVCKKSCGIGIISGNKMEKGSGKVKRCKHSEDANLYKPVIEDIMEKFEYGIFNSSIMELYNV